VKVGDLVKRKGSDDLALAIEIDKYHVTLMWLDDGLLDRCTKILMDSWKVVEAISESR
jgi:hypothetical protein